LPWPDGESSTPTLDLLDTIVREAACSVSVPFSTPAIPTEEGDTTRIALVIRCARISTTSASK
jgi:hypothetical protein